MALEAKLKEANKEKNSLLKMVAKDSNFKLVEQAVYRIQQAMLYREKLRVSDDDYTLLKQLFGECSNVIYMEPDEMQMIE